jgi:polyketide cyclase/dehydrase/lipid transport protein
MMILLVTAAALTGEGYDRIGEKSGVTVYRRHGHAIDLAAEGDIDATPDVVLKVLTDYGSHPKWVHGLAVSRVVDRGDRSLDVYQRLSLPMLDDRDFSMHVTWSGSGDVRTIRFKTTNDKAPPLEKGVVRVPLHEGSWQLESVDGGRRTHAVYQFQMELGGSLPMWMARGRACKDVPGLFDAIRKQVQYYK